MTEPVPGPGAEPSETLAAGEGGRLAGQVVGRRTVGSFFRIDLEVPGWRSGRAGQFALLQPEPSRVFLPRAFSLHDQDTEAVSFLVAPIGAGTDELVQARPGDPIWVLGPLGRGFDPDVLAPHPRGRCVLVGGGVGVAPLPLVMESLSQSLPPDGGEAQRGATSGLEILVLLGFRDAAQAAAADTFGPAVERARARGSDVRVEVITEDGSLGRAGLVTTLLGDELRPGDVVAGCGAHAMCGAVWEICRERGCEGWFSLEAGMACGVGSCQGCVVTMADGALARVCKEGPVFSGEIAFGARRATCAPGSA